MPSDPRPDKTTPAPATNPTIFLRLNDADPAPREFAWDEFEARYAPIIAAFARRLGARPQDVDDIIQDVLLGFFIKSPTFLYDPARGRFRGYLKVCTYRAARKRLGAQGKLAGVSLEQIDSEALAVEQAWNDIWEQDQLRRALDDVRRSMGHTKTFQAFEKFVVLDQPAQAVAEKMGMHVNSVYRAREQVTQLLHEKIARLSREEG